MFDQVAHSAPCRTVLFPRAAGISLAFLVDSPTISQISLVEASRRNILQAVTASIVLRMSSKNASPRSGRIFWDQRRSLTCMLYVRATRLQLNSAPDSLLNMAPFAFPHACLSTHHSFFSCPAMSSTLNSSQDPNVHASNAHGFYAAAITSYIIAVAAVALRFWARKLMSTRLWVDDWTVAGALVRSQNRIHN